MNLTMNRNRDFYNGFHKYSTLQKKLISDNNFTYETTLKVFNKHIKSSDTVLDVGCGIGVISLYYGNKCKSVHGIDISDKAIKLANESAKELKLNQKIKFEVVDFPNKYLDKKFDKIIFSETLEHIQNEDLALQSISKMLNKNGQLIVTVPSVNSFIYRIGLAKKFDKEVGHLRRYTVDSLKSRLEKNGFKVLKIYKREGLIRNILFFMKPFGFLIKFMKGFIGKFIIWLDSQTIKLVGESQIIIVATKK